MLKFVGHNQLAFRIALEKLRAIAYSDDNALIRGMMFMYKKWYKKLLLSYLPIVLALSMFIVTIFSIMAFQFIRQEAQKANQLFNEHLSQMMDNSLSILDESLIHGIYSSEVEQYMNPSINANPYIVSSNVSTLLRNLVGVNTLLHSVYIYKADDNTVISSSHKSTLDNFMDKDFVLEELAKESLNSWSKIRTYQAIDGDSSVQVVSIVRKITGFNGEKGILVANVSTQAIKRFLSKYAESRSGYFRILDSQGQTIMNSDETENATDAKALAVIHSTQSNWTYVSGNKKGSWWDYFNIVSYIWLFVLGIGILLAFGFTFYLTKRNYKPIDSIMSQIDTYMLQKQSKLEDAKKDEFGFIRDALDSLIEETTNYKKAHQEGVTKQLKIDVKEWLEGNKELHENTYKWLLKNFPEASNSFVYIFVEIDNYAEITVEYKARDTNLFKYVIEAAFAETAELNCLQTFSSWYDANRFGAIVQLRDLETGAIQEFGKQYLEWVKKNLPFTLTLGISSEYESLSDLPEGYNEALAALKYKLVLGDNRMIFQEQVVAKERHESFRHIELIIAISRSIRTGDNAQWKEYLGDLIKGLANDYSSNDDIIGVLRYLHYYLHREAGLMPEDQSLYCKEHMLPQIDQMISQTETLSSLHAKLIQLLEMTSVALAGLREDKQYHGLIKDVESFIQSNYANPDFSLTLLSETFQLKSSNISKLFKEVTGQNFVEYLLKVRIEQAKQLLILEQDVSIQDIGIRVGYLHAKTFIRLFKKETGVTPGEYRRHKNQ
ncbi:helix-turn-helix domain-containing protein [Paenibacillus sp. LjRoot153]|uniref:helix-turn-helix domain-containing protein n=1 Tax=unclassified Paenibacillus TaxID=185978 RepID=UPI000708D82D|nr:helix-turn-helix domain-containing protein [Paenibacillus sp. Soil766]KRF09747.1 hypothetical protein ASG89_16170 [Paenibacillus sp. Soil766]